MNVSKEWIFLLLAVGLLPCGAFAGSSLTVCVRDHEGSPLDTFLLDRTGSFNVWRPQLYAPTEGQYNQGGLLDNTAVCDSGCPGTWVGDFVDVSDKAIGISIIRRSDRSFVDMEPYSGASGVGHGGVFFLTDTESQATFPIEPGDYEVVCYVTLQSLLSENVAGGCNGIIFVPMFGTDSHGFYRLYEGECASIDPADPLLCPDSVLVGYSLKKLYTYMFVLKTYTSVLPGESDEACVFIPKHKIEGATIQYNADDIFMELASDVPEAVLKAAASAVLKELINVLGDCFSAASPFVAGAAVTMFVATVDESVAIDRNYLIEEGASLGTCGLIGLGVGVLTSGTGPFAFAAGIGSSVICNSTADFLFDMYYAERIKHQLGPSMVDDLSYWIEPIAEGQYLLHIYNPGHDLHNFEVIFGNMPDDIVYGQVGVFAKGSTETFVVDQTFVQSECMIGTPPGSATEILLGPGVRFDVALFESSVDVEHLQACFRSLYTQQDIGPTAVLASPLPGATVSGVVQISANASDDHYVAKVYFYGMPSTGSSWSLLGTDSDGSNGWSISFDTTGIEYDKPYWIAAIAVDSVGQQSAQSVVYVTIDNIQAPGIDIEPLSLNLDGVMVGAAAQTTFTIRNTGTQTLNGYTLSDTSWISNVNPYGWSVEPGKAKTITVTVSTSGLTAKTYYGTVRCETSVGNQSIPVTLRTITLPGCSSGTLQKNPVQDAYISWFAPSTNYNTGTISCDKRSGHYEAGLVKFDVSDVINSNVVITSARLYLYCNHYLNPSNDVQQIKIHRCASNWDEANVTWSQGIYYYTTPETSINCPGTGWIPVVDLTSTVKSWQNGTENKGLYLRFESPLNTKTQEVRFDSSEGSHPPELLIDYVIKDGVKPQISINAPYDGQVFHSPNTTVSGTAYDACGIKDVHLDLNNTYQDVSGKTNWSSGITLTEGTNLIEVEARDNSYEEMTKCITVFYFPPGFLLASDRVNVAVKQGRTGYCGIYLTSIHTFSSDVSLSISGVPAGVTAFCENCPVIPTGATNVVFSVPPGAGMGTFPVVFTCSGGGVTKQLNVNLIITDGTIPQVAIDSPTIESTYITSDKDISIGGTATDGETSIIRVSIDTGQTNTGTNEAWQFHISLSDGWNKLIVTAMDLYGNTSDDLIHIKYEPPLPGQVQVYSPTESQMSVPLNCPLQWEPAAHASSYDIYRGTSYESVDQATTDSSIYRGRQSGCAFMEGYWTADMDYYWRIDPVNITGITKGVTWHFKTIDTFDMGDANGDGVVDIFDLVLVSYFYGRQVGDGIEPLWSSVGDGSPPDAADINNNGVVNIFDLAIVGSAYNTD